MNENFYREFDQLFSRQKYEDVKPVTHIGVIDFDLDRIPGKASASDKASGL